MKWFYFHTYVRIPLFVLTIFASVLIDFSTNIDLINLIYAIYAIVVFVELHKRSIRGWQLNMVLLLIEAIIIAINISLFETSALIVFLLISSGLWAFPNYRYFKKRIDLFK